MDLINIFFKQHKIIDLTHDLNPNIPTWNGSCGFQQSIKMDYPEGCRVQSLKMHAGVGTHIDAPSHFIPNTISVAELSLSNLITYAHVIDVSNRNNEDYKLSIQDILTYEQKYGEISKNSFVIAYTGWDKFWNTPQKYRNPKEDGNMIFPGFSKEAAELLMKRNIAGIGIDTLSPDGSDMNFPVHKIILGANKFIVENLTNCERLTPHGSFVIALPLKVQEGTESAMRVVALVPNEG